MMNCQNGWRLTEDRYYTVNDDYVLVDHVITYETMPCEEFEAN